LGNFAGKEMLPIPEKNLNDVPAKALLQSQVQDTSFFKSIESHRQSAIYSLPMDGWGVE